MNFNYDRVEEGLRERMREGLSTSFNAGCRASAAIVSNALNETLG